MNQYGNPPAVQLAQHCMRCGQPSAEVWDPTVPGWRHNVCRNPDDRLSVGWVVLAYLIVIPFGCTLIGAIVASIPYYTWRHKFPNRARAYNRHVWIGFAVSCALWLLLAAGRH